MIMWGIVGSSEVKVSTHSQEWRGDGKGQADDVSTHLPEGSYVIDAHSVSALGDGSTNAGIKVLKEFERQVLEKYLTHEEYQEALHEKGTPSKAIPALVSDGEYLIRPLVVTLLGHLHNSQGAHYLKMMVRNLRIHKRSNGINLPPKAKNIWDYLPPSAKKRR